MADKSLFDSTINSEKIEYINECVREVCINGDDLSKYEKMIGKRFPDDPAFYAKVTTFVDKCKEMANKPSLSATSIENIKYLASEIHVTEKTVDEILKAKKGNIPTPQPPTPQPPTPQNNNSKMKIGIIIAIVAIAIMAAVGYFAFGNNSDYSNAIPADTIEIDDSTQVSAGSTLYQDKALAYLDKIKAFQNQYVVATFANDEIHAIFIHDTSMDNGLLKYDLETEELSNLQSLLQDNCFDFTKILAAKYFNDKIYIIGYYNEDSDRLVISFDPKDESIEEFAKGKNARFKGNTIDIEECYQDGETYHSFIDLQ